MPRKQSTEKEHHSHYFLHFVFHCETERTPGEPADDVSISFGFSQVRFGLASLREISIQQVCGLVVCSNHLV